MRIKSQNLWDDRLQKFRPGALEIKGSKISAIDFDKEALKKPAKDFGRAMIGPSAIDLHVHARDFEESHKETFETLDAAANKGGVAVAACMANTKPTCDTPERVKEFLKKASSCTTKLIPFAAATEGLLGEKDTPWKELLKLATAGISDDGKPILDEKRLERLLKIAHSYKKIVALHEEDTRISEKSQVAQSATAIRLGLPVTPSASEYKMIERDLLIAKKAGAAVHLCHLSAKESVELLKKFKKQGVHVTSELTPHHALLNVDDLLKFNAHERSLFKVCPSIRSKEDQDAVCKALRDGVIDCLASDHAPHSDFEKDVPYEDALHGMISMEYFYPLCLEVKNKAKLTWTRFFNAIAEKPAELLNLSKTHGKILPGYLANLVIFDPSQKQACDWGLSKSKNTPFIKREVSSTVLAHVVEGNLVYEKK